MAPTLQPILNERTLTILGLAASIFAAVVGLMIFYGRYAYAEEGHNYLVIGYLLASIGIFFGIRLWNIPLFVIALGLAILIQIYSGNKFTWRENYVGFAQMGQPFALNEFIDHFPTYEEYTFRFLKNPDWVRFNQDCVQPAMAKQPVGPHCGSLDDIQNRYYIDMKAAMENHYGKMRRTARMVEEGKMNKRSAYAECIANKICVEIPLLPKGVDANKIDPTSREHLEIRQAFWSLINHKRMSDEVCKMTMMCQALVNMKAVKLGALPF